MQLEWLALAMPLVAAAILLTFFRKQTVWWEIAVLLIASLGTLVLSHSAMVTLNTRDTEYLGSYAVRVEYDEPWNEYINQTCTRQCCPTTDSKGNTTYGSETYDCSYVEYHSAQYRKIDQLGHSFTIDEVQYRRLAKQFATAQVFTDMHRDYHTQDGDRYSYAWAGEREKLATITFSHGYENKIQASQSIFHLLEVNEKTKAQYQLYEYPDIDSEDLQVALLSRNPVNYERDARPYDELNALLGATKQVRVFVLLFENQPRDAANWQRNYWQGGNKNELVICIGTKQGQVQWCNAFAWEDKPLTEIKIRDLFLQQGTLNLRAAAPEIERIITANWKRKQFADFAYLRVELTRGQLFGVYFLVLFVTVGITVRVVVNGYTDKDDEPTGFQGGGLLFRNKGR